MVKKYQVKLLRKEKLARDTWLFAFEKPSGYIFVPGQYHTFTLSLPSGKTDWRDMTITSSPHHHELWLVTKISKNSSVFKRELNALPIGSAITLEGPSGGFTIRDEKSHVFLSGGIGINVFHSILMDAAEKNSQIPMTLFASFSTKHDKLFYKELKKIENDKRNIIFTLTKEEWNGERGRISKELLQKYVSTLRGNIYMIAGGQEFVDAMNELLLQMRVPEENIRIDYFTGY